ncbi:pantothenate kinase [Kitasatospora sp. SolWspMP-SS2h]|uniref:nucleoside/nucleotide kinase family protein n=1 Tax=Kitasatospora sp. SolWspMP-SS2h TaxID=1305729 RepID=UPI000DB92FEC|nr:nucleoside/nucleotide kinase family protein [Kitasatospora sp. SolWspMP-SS2h]RAJ43245.1 pantothenate kinase [Kitasatospora sp. SolWspMP-SS2h]
MHVEGTPSTAPDPAPTGQPATAEQAVARALGLLHGPGSGTGRTLLGLAGPPAAGKSTLARLLIDEVNHREGPDTAAYLPLDGFHLSNAQLDRLDLRPRKGAPETFDARGYLALLQRVATDRFHEVYAPDFDRTLDEPVAARHLIRPHTRLVVTEGNYLAAPATPWTDARALLRELWYVDADERTRDARLLARHTAGGQDGSAARRRVDGNDGPNAAYVATTRAACDWVVRPGEFASVHQSA